MDGLLQYINTDLIITVSTCLVIFIMIYMIKFKKSPREVFDCVYEFAYMIERLIPDNISDKVLRFIDRILKVFVKLYNKLMPKEVKDEQENKDRGNNS